MRNIKPLFTIITAILCLALFTQCSSEKQTERSEKAENATNVVNYVGDSRNNGIKIAYINLDTVMYCYEFALDINKEMISKEAKMVATLESKRKVIEEEIAQFEYKCNARIFADEETYIKEYNDMNGYDFILTKIGDNILYANKAYDITMDIIDGLNRRYKNNRIK